MTAERSIASLFCDTESILTRTNVFRLLLDSLKRELSNADQFPRVVESIRIDWVADCRRKHADQFLPSSFALGLE